MPIFKGNNNIESIYKGNIDIQRVYNGSVIVFDKNNSSPLYVEVAGINWAKFFLDVDYNQNSPTFLKQMINPNNPNGRFFKFSDNIGYETRAPFIRQWTNSVTIINWVLNPEISNDWRFPLDTELLKLNNSKKRKLIKNNILFFEFCDDLNFLPENTLSFPVLGRRIYNGEMSPNNNYAYIWGNSTITNNITIEINNELNFSRISSSTIINVAQSVLLIKR